MTIIIGYISASRPKEVPISDNYITIHLSIPKKLFEVMNFPINAFLKFKRLFLKVKCCWWLGQMLWIVKSCYWLDFSSYCGLSRAWGKFRSNPRRKPFRFCPTCPFLLLKLSCLKLVLICYFLMTNTGPKIFCVVVHQNECSRNSIHHTDNILIFLVTSDEFFDQFQRWN